MSERQRLGPLPEDLAGRRAVVTGGAHGIGEAIARRLLWAGAEVVVIDRDAARLDQAFPSGMCHRVVADFSNPDLPAVADRLVRDLGPISLVVNNVATSMHRSFLELPESGFDTTINTNLRGPWFFTRRLVQALRDRGERGSLLFISSLHDTFIRTLPDYSVTKAGIAMLTRELAFELAPFGIRVNAISPGWIETAKAGEPKVPEQHAVRLIPAGRFGQPDEIAKLAIVLLSDAWSLYVTGINLPVDGGLALHNWLMDV